MNYLINLGKRAAWWAGHLAGRFVGWLAFIGSDFPNQDDRAFLEFKAARYGRWLREGEKVARYRWQTEDYLNAMRRGEKP